MPVLTSLRDWAETWLPDDPAMIERDPDVVLGWLAQRVRTGDLPGAPVVLEISLLEHGRYWLVMQGGVAPYGCLTDPLLDGRRYVYLRCATATMLALARGRRDWAVAFGDGSVVAAGDPDLCRCVADWFESDHARHL